MNKLISSKCYIFYSFIKIRVVMQDLIEIDGSLHQGGGQMIRSSLALSLILKKEFRMVNIRKNRPNPGINNQLRSIFSAFTDKLPKVGDFQIYFFPKFLEPTQIKAATAASCTLMMQCLVPVFAGIGYEKMVRINGGTDVSRSPPLESLKLGLIPLLERMGVMLKIQDVKPGFYPVGKGYVDIRVLKVEIIKPLKMIELGSPKKVVISYYVKDNKVPGSSKQLRKQINRLLTKSFGQGIKIEFIIQAHKVFCTKDDYGIGCVILGDNLIWDIGTVGQKVKEDVLIGRLEHLVDKKCCLDEHHQDQLLLYAALANGRSQLLVGEELSLHTHSLIYVLQKFIPGLQINHEKGILSIQGINYFKVEAEV